jgi:membrane-bound serine protease (ClpP class)
VVGLGIALVVVGLLLLVIEAHLPTAGVLGSLGAAGLVVGVVLAALGTGASPLLLVPVAALTGIASLWLGLVAARRVRLARQARSRTGAEALIGRLGVVRSASGPTARVFVEGALWRARLSWPDSDSGGLSAGDPVVVERVDGLTLSVRRAEEFEVSQ